MNPDLPPDNRAELEARVTAMLLGELSDEEAAALRQTISQDAALAKLHERLRRTLDLLRATAATSAGEISEQAAPLRLSPRRREMLLAHFKTVSPKELARPRGRKVSLVVELAALAAIVMVAVGVALPKLSRTKSVSARAMLGTALHSQGSSELRPQGAVRFGPPVQASVPRTDGRNGTNGMDRMGASGRVAMAASTLAPNVNPNRPASAPVGPPKSSIYVGKAVQSGDSMDDYALGVNRTGGEVDRGWNAVASASFGPPTAAKPASQPGSIYMGRTEESGKPGAADQGLTLNLRNVSTDQASSFVNEKAGTYYSFTPVTIVPLDSEMVTEVIPVHTLNPAQVSRDLLSLMPPGDKMTTSDAGNAIVMTGKQADVKRMAQTISELDKTGNGNLQVFRLQNANSKQVASELKDVFADTGTTGSAGGFNIATIMGGRGGRGGGGAAGADDARRTTPRVNAVADELNNAIVVSAPADYMTAVSNLIHVSDDNGNWGGGAAPGHVGDSVIFAGATSNEEAKRRGVQFGTIGGSPPAATAAPPPAPDPAVVARLQAQRATGNNSYATQGQVGPVTLNVDPNTGDLVYITPPANSSNGMKAIEARDAPMPQYLAKDRVTGAVTLTRDKNNPNIQGGPITSGEQLAALTRGEGAGNLARGPGFVSGAGSFEMAKQGIGSMGSMGSMDKEGATKGAFAAGSHTALVGSAAGQDQPGTAIRGKATDGNGYFVNEGAGAVTTTVNQPLNTDGRGGLTMRGFYDDNPLRADIAGNTYVTRTNGAVSGIYVSGAPGSGIGGGSATDDALRRGSSYAGVTMGYVGGAAPLYGTNGLVVTAVGGAVGGSGEMETRVLHLPTNMQGPGGGIAGGGGIGGIGGRAYGGDIGGIGGGGIAGGSGSGGATVGQGFAYYTAAGAAPASGGDTGGANRLTGGIPYRTTPNEIAQANSPLRYFTNAVVNVSSSGAFGAQAGTAPSFTGPSTSANPSDRLKAELQAESYTGSFTSANPSGIFPGAGPIGTNSISGLDGVSPYRGAEDSAARKADVMRANGIVVVDQGNGVVTRQFVLTNAESTDVASELGALFPNPNTQASNSRGRGGAATSPSLSARPKEQVPVKAVADARTQTVTVTASKDTMDQIGKIVGEMEAQEPGHASVYVYSAQNSNVLDLLGPLTELFPQQNARRASTSSQQDALYQRQTYRATQSTASAQSSIGARTEGTEGTKGTTQRIGGSGNGSAAPLRAVENAGSLTLAGAGNINLSYAGEPSSFSGRTAGIVGGVVAGSGSLTAEGLGEPSFINGVGAVGGGLGASRGSGRGGRGGAGGSSTGTNGNFSSLFVTQLGDPLQPVAPGQDTGTQDTTTLQGVPLAARRLAVPDAQKKAPVAGGIDGVDFDDIAMSKEAFASAGNVGVDGRIDSDQTLRARGVGELVAGTISGYVDPSAKLQPGTVNKVLMTNSFAAADRNSGVADFTLDFIDEASKANVAAAGGGFNGLYWNTIPSTPARERSGGERRNVDGSADSDLYAASGNLNGGVRPNAATVVNSWNNARGSVVGLGEPDSLKTLELAKAKKSGTILGDIPIIGGFFKKQEVPAAAAAQPTNYAMGNNFTEQIYASPAPASGSVRFTNGAGSFALDAVQEKLVAAKQAEANAGKHSAAVGPQTHALDSDWMAAKAPASGGVIRGNSYADNIAHTTNAVVTGVGQISQGEKKGDVTVGKISRPAYVGTPTDTAAGAGSRGSAAASPYRGLAGPAAPGVVPAPQVQITGNAATDAATAPASAAGRGVTALPSPIDVAKNGIIARMKAIDSSAAAIRNPQSTNAAGRGLPALPSLGTDATSRGSTGASPYRGPGGPAAPGVVPAPQVQITGNTASDASVSPMRNPQSAIRNLDAPPPKPASPPPVPQAEVQTRENAFSTFSLNVSDVSFRLAAASLEKGLLPDAATVRSEEFINAFNYRDSEPGPGAPVGFAWERAGYPFAHNRDLLRFAVKTASEGRQADRALNLVLLLDKSGSMERADRVAIIAEALRVLGTQLKGQDTVSVVVFARTARLFADGVSGGRFAALAAELEALTPEGGTNLEEAMRLAYEAALRHYLANGENRVVLLTDGAANLGDVEPGDLKKRVEAYRAQGVALDCFGVGWEDYNDNLLEVLSRSGGGRYGFVNTPEEAATGFAGQLAGALRVAASDVKVQVEFNPGRVISYRQIGYAKDQLKKEEFRDNSVKAAQMAVAESGNALYTVELNPAGDGPICTVYVRYRTPGTSDYYEHAWAVPYTGAADPLDKASPPMRLAATASAFAEWLAGSPYAGEVTLNKLQGYLRGVPEFYGADARPKLLETMLREAGR